MDVFIQSFRLGQVEKSRRITRSIIAARFSYWFNFSDMKMSIFFFIFGGHVAHRVVILHRDIAHRAMTLRSL